MKVLSSTTLLGALVTAGLVLAVSAADAQFYKGKTLKIVTNASAGGSTGVSSQTFANVLAKHIPGNPEIIVQPVPGGAQLKGINFVKNARANGLTIGWSAWSGATRILDPKNRQVAFHEFKIIGGAGTPPMLVIRSDAGPGVKTATDLMKAGKIKFGGFRPASTWDMRARLSFELLGVPYDYVSGFRGGRPAHAALLRKEINVRAPALGSSYLGELKDGMVKEGKLTPLFYWGLPTGDGPTKGYAAAEGISTFYDFHKAVKGKAPSGPKWDAIKFMTNANDAMTWLVWAPAKTPDDRVAILRKAFVATAKDPEFIQAMVKRTKMAPTIVMPKDAEELVNSLRSTDKAIIDTMRDSIDRAKK